MKVISLLLLLTACATENADPDFIRRIFKEKHEKFRQCYLESETFTKKITAQIKTRVLIDSGGSVKEANVLESNTKDPNFNACIEGQLKRLKFPRPAEGQTVNIVQGFNFQPGIP